MDLTDGDVRAVRGFSRHRDRKGVLICDDARRDIVGDVASKVANDVGTGKGAAILIGGVKVAMVFDGAGRDWRIAGRKMATVTP